MNYDNNMNGFSNNNYYPPNNYQQPRQPIMNQYVFVNGVDGAKAYNLMPNQTILLMDNDSPFVYMKTANQLGQTTIRYFKLVETSEDEAKGVKENKDYVSRNEFDEMKKKIDKILKGGKDNA